MRPWLAPGENPKNKHPDRLSKKPCSSAGLDSCGPMAAAVMSQRLMAYPHCHMQARPTSPSAYMTDACAPSPIASNQYPAGLPKIPMHRKDALLRLASANRQDWPATAPGNT
jgi:hypothetical protein